MSELKPLGTLGFMTSLVEGVRKVSRLAYLTLAPKTKDRPARIYLHVEATIRALAPERDGESVVLVSSPSGDLVVTRIDDELVLSGSGVFADGARLADVKLAS